MKNFVMFCYDGHDSLGGVDDYHAQSDSLLELQNEFEKCRAEYCQIVRMSDFVILARGRFTLNGPVWTLGEETVTRTDNLTL